MSGCGCWFLYTECKYILVVFSQLFLQSLHNLKGECVLCETGQGRKHQTLPGGTTGFSSPRRLLLIISSFDLSPYLPIYPHCVRGKTFNSVHGGGLRYSCERCEGLVVVFARCE